jgi:hypothetical protein
MLRSVPSSLATSIAWLSTCLLAGGVSTLLSDATRNLWMLWGCFGLTAAVGLEAAAYIREQIRTQKANRMVQERFKRELQCATAGAETNATTRRAVARLLGDGQRWSRDDELCRTAERYPCDFNVELVSLKDISEDVCDSETPRLPARLDNISHNGFSLTLAERLAPQPVALLIRPPDGGRIDMLGEILWCGSQSDGSIAAGGRLIRVLSAEGLRP